jgi:hypothetical protein
MVNFYNKYLKYKNKYFQLKTKIIGGSIDTNTGSLPKLIHSDLLWITYGHFIDYIKKLVICSYLYKELKITFIAEQCNIDLKEKLSEHLFCIDENNDWLELSGVTKYTRESINAEGWENFKQFMLYYLGINNITKEALLNLFNLNTDLIERIKSSQCKQLSVIDNLDIYNHFKLFLRKFYDDNENYRYMKQTYYTTLDYYTPRDKAQAQGNKDYENNEGLLDKYHYGIKGFNSFMDKFAENLEKINTNPIDNPNIYIIADSTIDYSSDYNNEKDNMYVKNRHKSLIRIFLRHRLIKIKENIYIDAVGGSGYISDLSKNYTFFTKLCELYNEIQKKIKELEDSDESKKSDVYIAKFIELLNYLLVNEIIIIFRDYFLSRIFTHFFCQTPTSTTTTTIKPQYTNIICFGFGNDIDFFTSGGESYNQKNLLLFMQIFWKFADIIISNYDEISKYNYNASTKQLELL